MQNAALSTMHIALCISQCTLHFTMQLHVLHCILQISGFKLHAVNLQICKVTKLKIFHITSYTLHLTHCILHTASYILHFTHWTNFSNLYITNLRKLNLRNLSNINQKYIIKPLSKTSLKT